MKDLAKAYRWNVVLRIVAFLCITGVTIYFKNPRLMWWYLAPLVMGVSCSDGEGEVKE